MAPAPPLGIGQPPAWPSMPSIRAKAADPGLLKDKKEWAPIPAIKAFVISSLKRLRTSCSTDKSANLPNRAIWNGGRGGWIRGRRLSGNRLRQLGANG